MDFGDGTSPRGLSTGTALLFSKAISFTSMLSALRTTRTVYKADQGMHPVHPYYRQLLTAVSQPYNAARHSLADSALRALGAGGARRA